MGSLVIIVWTETVKDEEQIYKEKSAYELRVLLFFLLLEKMMLLLFHSFTCVL